MNWVGGVRSRLRLQNERKIQKEYFERNKFARRIKRVHPGTPSSKGVSQDLVNLHMISKIYDDVAQKPKEKRSLTKVDFNNRDTIGKIHMKTVDMGKLSPITSVSRIKLADASERSELTKQSDSLDSIVPLKPRRLASQPKIIDSDIDFKTPFQPHHMHHRMNPSQSSSQRVSDQTKLFSDRPAQPMTAPPQRTATHFWELETPLLASTDPGRYHHQTLTHPPPRNNHTDLNRFTIELGTSTGLRQNDPDANKYLRHRVNDLMMPEDFQSTPLRKYNDKETKRRNLDHSLSENVNVNIPKWSRSEYHQHHHHRPADARAYSHYQSDSNCSSTTRVPMSVSSFDVLDDCVYNVKKSSVLDYSKKHQKRFQNATKHTTGQKRTHGYYSEEPMVGVEAPVVKHPRTEGSKSILSPAIPARMQSQEETMIPEQPFSTPHNRLLTPGQIHKSPPGLVTQVYLPPLPSNRTRIGSMLADTPGGDSPSIWAAVANVPEKSPAKTPFAKRPYADIRQALSESIFMEEEDEDIDDTDDEEVITEELVKQTPKYPSKPDTIPVSDKDVNEGMTKTSENKELNVFDTANPNIIYSPNGNTCDKETSSEPALNSNDITSGTDNICNEPGSGTDKICNDINSETVTICKDASSGINTVCKETNSGTETSPKTCMAGTEMACQTDRCVEIIRGEVHTGCQTESVCEPNQTETSCQTENMRHFTNILTQTDSISVSYSDYACQTDCSANHIDIQTEKLEVCRESESQTETAFHNMLCSDTACQTEAMSTCDEATSCSMIRVPTIHQFVETMNLETYGIGSQTSSDNVNTDFLQISNEECQIPKTRPYLEEEIGLKEINSISTIEQLKSKQCDRKICSENIECTDNDVRPLDILMKSQDVSGDDDNIKSMLFDSEVDSSLINPRSSLVEDSEMIHCGRKSDSTCPMPDLPVDSNFVRFSDPTLNVDGYTKSAPVPAHSGASVVPEGSGDVKVSASNKNHNHRSDFRSMPTTSGTESVSSGSSVDHLQSDTYVDFTPLCSSQSNPESPIFPRLGGNVIQLGSDINQESETDVKVKKVVLDTHIDQSGSSTNIGQSPPDENQTGTDVTMRLPGSDINESDANVRHSGSDTDLGQSGSSTSVDQSGSEVKVTQSRSGIIDESESVRGVKERHSGSATNVGQSGSEVNIVESGSSTKIGQSGSNGYASQTGSDEKSLSGSNTYVGPLESVVKTRQPGPYFGSDKNIGMTRHQSVSKVNGKSQTGGKGSGSIGDMSNSGSDGNIRQSGSEGNVSQSGSEGNVSQSGSEGNVSQSGSEGNVSQSESDRNLSQSGSDRNMSQSKSDGNIGQTGSLRNMSKAGSDGNILKSGSHVDMSQSGSETNVNQSKSNENIRKSGSHGDMSQSGSDTNVNQSVSGGNMRQSGSDRNMSQSKSDGHIRQTGSLIDMSQSGSDGHIRQSGSDRTISQSRSDANVSQSKSDGHIRQTGSLRDMSQSGSDGNIRQSGSDRTISQSRSDANVSHSESDRNISQSELDANVSQSVSGGNMSQSGSHGDISQSGSDRNISQSESYRNNSQSETCRNASQCKSSVLENYTFSNKTQPRSNLGCLQTNANASVHLSGSDKIMFDGKADSDKADGDVFTCQVLSSLKANTVTPYVGTELALIKSPPRVTHSDGTCSRMTEEIEPTIIYESDLSEEESSSQNSSDSIGKESHTKGNTDVASSACVIT